MRSAELLPHESKPAPGDLRFVQAFVNTLDVESGRDELADPEGLGACLGLPRCLGEGRRLTPGGPRVATRLREALRTVLTEGSERDPEALAVLDEVGRRARLCVVGRPDGELALAPAG